MSIAIASLEINKITQHRGCERPTVSSDVAVCSLGLEGILMVPGDMFLSIAKVLAWRREPVCYSRTRPVVHATQSMSMTKSDHVVLHLKFTRRVDKTNDIDKFRGGTNGAQKSRSKNTSNDEPRPQSTTLR